jgi:molecular chaperone GrpE
MDKENNKKGNQEATEISELDKLKKERDEYLAGWRRSRADFLNYKKEETERLAKLIQFANEDLIGDLLYVLDSFSLVESSLQDKEDLKPFLLIRSQLENVLRVRGLEKIKTQKGEDFNPEVHEAVEIAGGSDSEPPVVSTEPHKIFEVVAEGYYLNGKLIRPAKVKVSK